MKAFFREYIKRKMRGRERKALSPSFAFKLLFTLCIFRKRGFFSSSFITSLHAQFNSSYHALWFIDREKVFKIILDVLQLHFVYFVFFNLFPKFYKTLKIKQNAILLLKFCILSVMFLPLLTFSFGGCGMSFSIHPVYNSLCTAL